MAWSHLLTLSPRWLRAIWKSGYKEVKASVHPAAQGMRWLSPLSPSHARGGGNAGFKWLVHKELFEKLEIFRNTLTVLRAEIAAKYGAPVYLKEQIQPKG